MASVGLFVIPSAVLAAPAPAPPSGREHLFEQLGRPQPAAPTWLVILTAVFAFAISGGVFVARWVVTAGHVGGHAVAAGTFGELTGLAVNRGPGGVAVLNVKAKGDGLTQFLVVFLGCLGPSLFGLLGAYLLAHDHIVDVLWAAIGLLGLLLYLNSGVFGALMLLVLGGGLFAVVWSDGYALHAVVAYLLVWSLLWGGVQNLLTVGGQAGRALEAAAAKAKAGPMTCQGHLRKQTYVPRGFWALVQLIPSVAALYLGIRLLVF